MTSPCPPLLEARAISKAFPGVQALEDVNLRLEHGEVLAVVGENGAGKSTLMKVLAGVEKADAGTVLLDGEPLQLKGVEDAERAGINLIHQELNLAENLDVAGNVFLGREPRWQETLSGLIERRIYSDAEAITRRLGLTCSPRTPVADLSIGQQQLVEIARALSLRSRVLIMDEPTSSLTQSETDRLFEVIHDLRRSGISLLYISHRLKEVEIIADRVTVLRDGRNAGELGRGAIQHEAMVRLMVGRKLEQFFHRTRSTSTASPQPPVLRARALRLPVGAGRPFDLDLVPGEVVGLAGLMGAGRSELGEALFGIRPALAGTLEVKGELVSPGSPAEAIAHGVFLLPEDRRSQALAASVKDNITLSSLDRVSVLGLIARRREEEVARTMCARLNVRTPSIRQTVGLLSGGNQQKVVLAKWLTRTPVVLILDEPTRGIDVGAKTEIYALMDQLANQGVAILMISSDLEEVLGMSDRVLVMHQGSLAGELTRGGLTEEAIMHLATGGAERS